jgi:HEAT repeat protein
MNLPEEIPFQQMLDALLDAEVPLNPRFLYRLSDLEPSEVTLLADIWPKIPLWRRQALLEDVEELGSSDTLLSFQSFGAFAAHDDDPKVRLYAIRTLWEYEDKRLIPLLVKVLKQDDDAGVRAASATALGGYVYLGELEEIPETTLREIEDLLLEVVDGSDQPQVRRSALEALGYSSREEMPRRIESAFTSKDKDWVASALFAMGRSGNEIWEKPVLDSMESPIPLIRTEAARAAGELELKEAVPSLLELLDDPDEDTILASIWSLSQIGGEGVREALEDLYEKAEDDQEIDLLESALDNLAFTEEMQLMPLFVLPEFDEEDNLIEDDGLNDEGLSDLDAIDYYEDGEEEGD